MAKQLACAEGDLNQRVDIELSQLCSLGVRCDKECAVGYLLGCVDYLLHVEATAIFAQDTLEHGVICGLGSLTLVFALFHCLPDGVRFFQRLHLVVIAAVSEAGGP